jgi:hypothetical protein
MKNSRIPFSKGTYFPAAQLQTNQIYCINNSTPILRSIIYYISNRIAGIKNGITACIVYSAVLFCLAGCSVYTSQVTTPVLIEKKGEMQIDGNLSFSNFFHPGAHGTITYGLFDNVALQSSFNYIFKRKFHYDVSLGYSLGLSEHFSLGLYPGFSAGHSDIYIHNDWYRSYYSDDFISGSYKTPYVRLQTLYDFHFVFIALSCRTGWFMPNFTKNNSTILNQQGFLLEPGISIVLYYKNFGGNIGYSYGKIFRDNELSEYINPYGIFSLGMNYRFQLGQKKKTVMP